MASRSLDMTVLIADADAFQGGYVAAGLKAAGATIIGPATSSSHARRHLESGPALDAVILADRLPEADTLALVELLSARTIAHLLLIGLAGDPNRYHVGTPMLRVPFAAFQVVDWAGAIRPDGPAQRSR